MLSMFFMIVASQTVHAQSNPVAIYSVPVARELVALASFAVKPFEMRRNENGEKKIFFPLPGDLTGSRDVRVELQGQLPAEGMSTAWVGPEATAQCFTEKGSTLCSMRYKWLGSSLPSIDEIRKYLSAKYAGDPDLQSRIQVAEIFSRDPAGTIRFSANIAEGPDQE